MDRRYWEEVGDDYEDEILDSSANDVGGVVRRRLDELADPAASAADFGCGVGHYLPLLASRFRRVYALDFAERLVERARHRARRFSNVEVHRADLARRGGRLPVPRVRVGTCMNVLISEDAALRGRILRGVYRGLVRGGRVLLLLPSLESVLFSNQRLVEWNRRQGFAPEEALASGLPVSRRTARDLLAGLVRIEGVPTKHYLREEAQVWLEGTGFAVDSVDRVEYGWDTEFEAPPRWMGRPGPWDWLFVARRKD